MDGEPLAPGQPTLLRDGTIIQLGQTRLLFREDATAACERVPVTLISGTQARSQVSMSIDASRLMLEMQGRAMPEPDQSGNMLRRLQGMAQVSIGLGAERDRRKLMDKIMAVIFDIFPDAERAFVLLRDPDRPEELTPAAARTRDAAAGVDRIALSRTIVNEVLRGKHTILSSDAMEDARFASGESVVDLKLRSVMCAPLIMEDEVLGLIQVDTSGAYTFGKDDLHILTGVGAQTAVILRNFDLYEEIEHLFEGFVKASVHAIEARDPSTAGHSFRVAEYTERLARAVDRQGTGAVREVRFTAEQLREIRYAALLHDFGKVGVREHILTKPKKLYPHQMDLLRERFRRARATLEQRALRELVRIHEQEDLSHAEFVRRRQQMDRELGGEFDRLERFFELIRQANEPTVDVAEAPRDLEQVLRYTFDGQDDEPVALLSEFEFAALTLSRGSLTPQERVQIESHVSHTFAFLNLMPWTRGLSEVPHIAHAHHEKLDGSGYPRGLHAGQIPVQSKIMAIADIYDALTAGDRPYKQGLPPDRALDILAEEARANKIDTDLFHIFVESSAYRVVSHY